MKRLLLRRGLLAAALVVATALPSGAHEPGLSALHVRVSTGQVVADLSLSAADAAAVTNLRAFSLETLACRMDDRPLRGTIGRVLTEKGGGVRIRVEFEREPGSHLIVHSAVSRWFGGGHREIVNVWSDRGHLLAERMFDPASMSVPVDLEVSGRASGDAARFFALGVEHILGGFDHLLFLAGLLIVAGSLREVVSIVTAFTVAHSLTLVLAVLGVVQVPPAIAEPLIAASIAYVGLENLVRRRASARWPLTFAFGLIHGFGFAGALRDLGIGVGWAGLVVPLASFNLGVEAGQIAVATVLLPIGWRLGAQKVLGQPATHVCSALIALAGSYWLIERLPIAR